MSPVIHPPESSSHQRELVSEMLDRLDAALADGAPLFAQQRMLSDLSVYAHLLARNSPFLARLSALELSLARGHTALHPAHLAEIRAWFHSNLNL